MARGDPQADRSTPPACWKSTKGRSGPAPTPTSRSSTPRRRWTIDPDEFRSKSRNTPYGGWEVRGRAHTVIVAGEVRHNLGGIVRQEAGPRRPERAFGVRIAAQSPRPAIGCRDWRAIGAVEGRDAWIGRIGLISCDELGRCASSGRDPSRDRSGNRSASRRGPARVHPGE